MTFGDIGQGEYLSMLANRRRFLRGSAMLVGSMAVSGLLAACGGDDDDDPGSGTSTSAAGEQSNATAAVATETSSGTDAEPSDLTEEDLTLRVGFSMTADIDSADPHQRTTRPIAYLENMMEPLVGFDADTFEIKPLLAESWEASDDALHWTVNLRQGLTFHDGSPVNGNAVEYAFNRIAHFKTSPASPLIENKIVSIAVVDDHTLEFEVNPGQAPLLQLLTMVLIVSQVAGEANEGGNMAGDFFRSNPIGAGPYKMQEWVRGSAMTMVKFDDYWGGWEPRQFTQVINMIVPEASAQQLMLEQGDLDIAGRYPSASLPTLRENPDITVDETEGFRILYLRLNNVAGFTRDVRVRRALAHALDYDAVVAANPGLLGPRTGPLPPAMMNGWMPTNLPEYDLELAASLLEEAEVPAGTTFSILTAASFPHQAPTAQILQAGLREIGYDLEITTGEVADWIGDIITWIEAGTDPEDYPSDLIGIVVGPRFPEGWAYLWYHYHSDAAAGAGANYYQYLSDAVDALIDEGAALLDANERIAKWQEAVNIIIEDTPDIYAGNEPRISVRRKHVEGYEYHPAWFPEMHFYPLRHA